MPALPRAALAAPLFVLAAPAWGQAPAEVPPVLVTAPALARLAGRIEARVARFTPIPLSNEEPST